PDDISSFVLKNCYQQMAKPLARMFNNSIRWVKFLRNGKMSTWSRHPIFKKDEKSEVENYRPISLLSCSSKVLERCI
ncbi:hypothetical protein CAPTEDRAFT_68586, partial [Capitella teleta]